MSLLLSARDRSQLLEVTHIPCSMTLSIFKGSKGEFPCHVIPLMLPISGFRKS